MRLVVPIIIGLLLMVGGVSGLSLTFQNSGDMNSVNTTPGFGYVTWVHSTDGKNSYLQVINTVAFNQNPIPMTYAAASSVGGGVGIFYILLEDSAGTILDVYAGSNSVLPGRLEVYMIGGQPKYYFNGALLATGPSITNPSYIGFGGVSTTAYIDDCVWGSLDSPYIAGMPEQNACQIQKDFTNPAASGLACSPSGVVVNSNNMTSTWGKNNNIPESIFLANTQTGVIYSTQNSGSAYAGTIQWPLENLFTSSAPFGLYQVYFANSSVRSVSIPYVGAGGTIAFNSHTYNQGDTATLTHTISTGDYWNTSKYDYKTAIRDIYGHYINNQSITTQTGTKNYAWTSADGQGVYYGILFATDKVTHQEIWMALDYTTLQNYFSINGIVNDGPTARNLTTSYVNVTQGGIITNLTTIDGNFTAGQMFTGSTVQINVTAPGYRQYNRSFIPMQSGSKIINVTLIPISPSVSGLGIGGVARTGTLAVDNYTISGGYGQPISGATVFLKNTTNSELYSWTTNNAGWYLADERSSIFLITKRPYNLWGQKIGFSNSANYTVVAP